MLVDNAEFFSRQRYYQGDFATAVELLGELLKAQRRLVIPGFVDNDENDGKEPGRRRIKPGGYKKQCRRK